MQANIDFYRRRLREELARLDAEAHPEVLKVHQKLVQLYRARIENERDSRWSVVRLRVAGAELRWRRRKG